LLHAPEVVAGLGAHSAAEAALTCALAALSGDTGLIPRKLVQPRRALR
jgi:hypothetical protein